MAGYCPSSLLVYVFMDRDEVEVLKKAKRTWKIFSYLVRTSLVNKGFIVWPNITTNKFGFAVTKRAIPSGQDLPARVANHNTGFASF